MRLIDANALIEEVQDWVDPFVLTFINNAPTVEPERPRGDLISREALIATIIEPLNVNDACKNDWYEGYYTAKNEDVTTINNAPTVKPICNQIAWEQGYEAGLAQGKTSRPQGTWLKSGKGKTTFFCSECGREIDTKPFTRPDKFPFCHCGADMRGGVKKC